MQRTVAQLTLVASVLIAVVANAQERQNPFACQGIAQDFSKDKGVAEIRSEIRKRIQERPQDAQDFCVIAELMKRVGNYEAEDYYKKAIAVDEANARSLSTSAEPAYELFFATYLRNFRGPQRPLFPDAEQHYIKAWSKLQQRGVPTPAICKDKQQRPFDCDTKDQIERGRIALYQEDGFPLLHSEEFERPSVFFSSINKYARSTTDFDRVDDTRAFTSEALFSSSRIRLNHSLSRAELRKIIRAKDQFETLNRFRFRYEDWPVIDIFYKYREIDRAQITNFFRPNRFGEVNLNEYGLAIEKPFNLGPLLDLYLRGLYKRIEREGTIEFQPHKTEDIDHYEAEATLSRFIGPDKANVSLAYVYQDIQPDVTNPPRRDREILAATFTYQIFRSIPFLLPNLLDEVYSQRFRPRGVDLFFGLLHDRETYSTVDVKKNDYFVGTAFRNLGEFDITVQPTIFTYDVEKDRSQDNKQYRTNFTVLYRLIDEEKQPDIPDKILGIHPAFLNLVFPVRHDVAIDGPTKFENFKLGIGLVTKLFTTDIRDTSFLLSAEYGFQRFYQLDKNLNLFSFSASMGF